MELKKYMSKTSNVFGENRLLKFVVIVLGAATVFNTFAMYSAQRMEKIILVPTMVDQKMWVSGDSVSDPYIRAFVRDAVNLRYNFSAVNARSNFGELLNMYDSGAYDAAKAQLLDFAGRVEDLKATGSFYISKITILGKNKIEIQGVKQVELNNQQAENGPKVLVLEFKVESGQMRITSFEEKDALEAEKAQEEKEKKDQKKQQQEQAKEKANAANSANQNQ